MTAHKKQGNSWKDSVMQLGHSSDKHTSHRRAKQNKADTTRMALIKAGLVLFGEYGFRGTTTRMLSEQSGANISAIPYYYGSKKGLYLAVIEHIIERLGVHVGDIRHDVQSKIEEKTLSKKEALKALNGIMGGMARLMVESDEPQAWVNIFIREQTNPTEGFEIFYEQHIEPMHSIITQLVANYTGLRATSDEVTLICHTLVGQIIVFVVDRESATRLLKAKRFTPKHIATIHKLLIQNTKAILSAATVKNSK